MASFFPLLYRWPTHETLLNISGTRRATSNRHFPSDVVHFSMLPLWLYDFQKIYICIINNSVVWCGSDWMRLEFVSVLKRIRLSDLFADYFHQPQCIFFSVCLLFKHNTDFVSFMCLWNSFLRGSLVVWYDYVQNIGYICCDIITTHAVGLVAMDMRTTT